MASAGFPLWQSIRVGYTETFQNFGKVLQLARRPFLVVIVAGFLVDLLSFFWHVEGRLGIHPLFGPWAEPILQTRLIVIECSLAIFVLAIFRYRLLGWSSLTDHVQLVLGKHEREFIGTALLSYAIHFISWRAVPSAALDSIASIILFSEGVALAIMVVLARLSFPLAAMVGADEKAKFRRVTFGEWLKLVIVLVFTKGLVSRLNNIEDILYEFGIDDVSYSLFFSWARDYMPMPIAALLHATILNVILMAISFFGVAIAATAVSEAYRLRSSPT